MDSPRKFLLPVLNGVLITLFFIVKSSYTSEFNDIYNICPGDLSENKLYCSHGTSLKKSYSSQHLCHSMQLCNKSYTEVTAKYPEDYFNTTEEPTLCSAQISSKIIKDCFETCIDDYERRKCTEEIIENDDYKIYDSTLDKNTHIAPLSYFKKQKYCTDFNPDIDTHSIVETEKDMTQFISHNSHYSEENIDLSEAINNTKDVYLNNSIEIDDPDTKNKSDILVIEDIYKSIPIFESSDDLNNICCGENFFNKESVFDILSHDNKIIHSTTLISTVNEISEKDSNMLHIVDPIQDEYEVEISTEKEIRTEDETIRNKKRSYSIMENPYINIEHTYFANKVVEDTGSNIVTLNSQNKDIYQKPSLKKLYVECWELNFSLNDIKFNHILNPNQKNILIFKFFENNKYEQIYNTKNERMIFPGQKFCRLYFRFHIPIYTPIEFTVVGQIKYFLISSILEKNGILQHISGSVVFLKSEKEQKNLNIHLKNIIDCDWNLLYQTLYEANFSIFDFSNYKYDKVIYTQLYNPECVKCSTNITEYFQKLGKMKFYFTNSKHIFAQEFFEGKRVIDIRSRTQISWFHTVISTFKSTPKIIKLFNQIHKIISDSTNTDMNHEKYQIYDLVENILSSLNPCYNIRYAVCKKGPSYHEEEILVSFYIFFHQGIKPLLEYWKKYIFDVEHREFIEGAVYF